MADYRIFETTVFLDDLEKLSPRDRLRLKRKLQAFVYPRLRQEPHFGLQIKRLRDWLPPTWRWRIGSFRLFYELDEDERLVLITALARRDKAYRR